MKTKRYFFTSAVGYDGHWELTFVNTDIITNEYPTFKKTLELIKEKHPYLQKTILLGISEIAKDDFDKFVSEQ